MTGKNDAVEGMPAYKWAVEFVRVDSSGLPVKGSSWFWTGEECSVGNAVNTSIDAMCNTADDPGHRRIACITNLTLVDQVPI